MAGAKSVGVLICFLLIIATSQAAPCKYSVCYRLCRSAGGSKAFCAKKCHCSLPSAFFSNGLQDEEMMMMEELMSFNESPTCNVEMAAAEMEVDYNRAEAVLEKMTMEELTSLNDKLAAKPKCKYNPCYRACRALGGSKAFCARKCNCIQIADVLAEGTCANDVDVEASTSTK